MTAAMDSTLQARLDKIVGVRAMSTNGNIVIPGSVTELVAVVRACAESATPFAVTSSKATSPASDTAAVMIGVEKLNDVSVDQLALICHAQAGASLESLRAAVSAAGLSVVGLAGNALAETVGGLVARGEIARRSVTGIEMVLPTGDHLEPRAVLKDVAGYDLAAAALGAMGRHVVVVAVDFRLEPTGAATPAAPPRGEATLASGPALDAAFDPQGLLRPGH